ncbi:MULTISPECIES: alpha/beta fold hydrolase [Pseudomonas]|uniref:Pimeloyl-ACP methyl ester carboxylesterase n=1 Tax=Pseudomonas delhiensis TaxID=366289 RepID=A0A239NJD8_9PSED|nr:MULTISPECIES: alpha/beta hydrolase [Pseudomonas]MED5610882.1 alpha/beta hydrolase [Pseudomonas sp. JH-2]PWU27860.1 alpha/beta hydrolase [Pseudomonas sp. RW407]SDK82091.1 Pimeloyl-ACP methyl ester carboxylesterase [Pseudomonas delhiensis]SNT55011.1 Pimeloyl-ACP methyl ester carboxylesterase [Pseudomonas delhiensis]
MRPETAVVEILQHRVYTEFHANREARQTIILVNGSLSTTASFAQTVKYLQPHFNVVCYDQPYAGGSKAHNDCREFISKEYEAQLLLGLIEHYRADVVMSFSWGGVATLLALAQRPSRIRKAVISSFSPLLNASMLDYLHRGLDYLGACDRPNVANLVNDTIGRYLPQLFKRYNFRHVAGLDDHEYRQMHFHVCQVLKLSAESYMEKFAAIDIPLLFVNGELDIYTTPAEAKLFQQLIRDCEFRTIRNAGHFIDVEHKQGWQDTRDALLGFLKPQRQPVSLSLGNGYLPNHEGIPLAALAG